MLLFSFSLLTVSLTLLIALAWYLHRDRNLWHERYHALFVESRQREQNLFDQMLRVKGWRPADDTGGFRPHADRLPVGLSPDELEIVESRVKERLQEGIMTPAEALPLLAAARTGQKTAAEIELELWKHRPPADPAGSVFEM